MKMHDLYRAKYNCIPLWESRCWFLSMAFYTSICNPGWDFFFSWPNSWLLSNHFPNITFFQILISVAPFSFHLRALDSRCGLHTLLNASICPGACLGAKLCILWGLYFLYLSDSHWQTAPICRTLTRVGVGTNYIVWSYWTNRPILRQKTNGSLTLNSYWNNKEISTLKFARKKAEKHDYKIMMSMVNFLNPLLSVISFCGLGWHCSPKTVKERIQK